MFVSVYPSLRFFFSVNCQLALDYFPQFTLRQFIICSVFVPWGAGVGGGGVGGEINQVRK